MCAHTLLFYATVIIQCIHVLFLYSWLINNKVMINNICAQIPHNELFLCYLMYPFRSMNTWNKLHTWLVVNFSITCVNLLLSAWFLLPGWNYDVNFFVSTYNLLLLWHVMQALSPTCTHITCIKLHVHVCTLLCKTEYRYYCSLQCEYLFQLPMYFIPKCATKHITSVGWQDLVTQFLVKITVLYKLVELQETRFCSVQISDFNLKR